MKTIDIWLICQQGKHSILKKKIEVMEKKFKTFKERKEYLLWNIEWHQKELLVDLRKDLKYSTEWDLKQLKLNYNLYRNMVIMKFGEFNILWLK